MCGFAVAALSDHPSPKLKSTTIRGPNQVVMQNEWHTGIASGIMNANVSLAVVLRLAMSSESESRMHAS